MKRKWKYSILLMLLFTLLFGCGSKKDEIDESNGFEIYDYEVNDIEGGVIVTYRIKNNADTSLVFEGIDIREYDRDDAMLDSYESYTRLYEEATLEAGESMELSLVFSYENGLSKVVSEHCIYKEDIEGDLLKEDFKTPYEVKLDD